MLNKDSIYFQQVKLLLEVIPYVAKETDFALKGGTAINLFVRDMPRLSIDIDLTYIPIKDRQSSLESISEALENIANDIEKRIKGSKVHRLQETHDEKITKLMVESNRVRIKIEASPVMRGCVKNPRLLSMHEDVEELFGFAEMQVVHFDDLYAGKICAALDRQHPRDLFDISYLMKNEGISDELIEVFLVYLISSNQPIAKLLQPTFIELEDTFKNHFQGMTTKEVDLKELEETRKELVKLINQRLKDKQKQFLYGFKQGKPDWSLFSLEGVKELPAVKWKMINLNRMTSKARKEATERLKQALKITK